MKVLFDIVHPADVLFFYHPIQKIMNMGHTVAVAARKKDVATKLLDEFKVPYICISRERRGILGLAVELIERDLSLFKMVRHIKPDVMVGFGGISISHVGKLLNIPAISFYDTESALLQHLITIPFISEMYVPQSYTGKTARGRTSRFQGQKDFSYFHPANFIPDREKALIAGYKTGEDNYFIRLVGWNANHDLGSKGWNTDILLKFVAYLAKKGAVHISSESSLPENLKRYEYTGPIRYIHHLLAYCKVYIGESATMASEAVTLGVPAICAEEIKRGYIDMLSGKSLVWKANRASFDSLKAAVSEVESLDKNIWQERISTFLQKQDNLAEIIVAGILKYSL